MRCKSTTRPSQHDRRPTTGVGSASPRLIQRRPVRARYHGHERLLCPHALGWTNARPRMLAYQAAGTTSTGPLPVAPQQRWRSMFIDEIEDPVITDDRWETADNYSHHFNGIDTIEIRA